LIILKLDNKLIIEQVFFDLDHTLWDFETNSKSAIADIYQEFNLQSCGFSLEQYLPVYLKCNAYCWDMYRKNLMNKDLLRHQRFYLSLKDFGIIDRKLAKQLGKRYVEISPTKTELMPGVKEILDYLHAKYPLHIITNGFQEIQAIKLKNTGIDHYFSKIITSERVGKRKPAPRIFEYALKKAICEPGQAVMIGDDLETDIQGAVNSGMQAIWYNHHRLQVANMQHVGIHHLLDLKNYL
jgi:putative hydrolase of the HAD superfamily